MRKVRFVSRISDLIRPEEYESDPDRRRIRVQLKIAADGMEIIADGPRAGEVERLLAALDPPEIEQALCG